MSNFGGVCCCWAEATTLNKMNARVRKRHVRNISPFREPQEADMKSSGTRPTLATWGKRIRETAKNTTDGRRTETANSNSNLTATDMCAVKYYCIQYLQLQWLATNKSVACLSLTWRRQGLRLHVFEV